MERENVEESVTATSVQGMGEVTEGLNMQVAGGGGCAFSYCAGGAGACGGGDLPQGGLLRHPRGLPQAGDPGRWPCLNHVPGTSRHTVCLFLPSWKGADNPW